MMPRREADLDADDTFLPMVLGVVSVVRRLSALLPLVAPEPVSPPPRESPEERPTLDLLLGLIAVHQRLGAVFTSVGEPVVAPLPAAAPTLPLQLELRR